MSRRGQLDWAGIRLYAAVALIVALALLGLWVVVTGRVSVAPDCPTLQRTCAT